jgi:hypothetical protein
MPLFTALATIYLRGVADGGGPCFIRSCRLSLRSADSARSPSITHRDARSARSTAAGYDAPASSSAVYAAPG